MPKKSQINEYSDQTFHIIDIVIHLVLISNTNPKASKIPFKTQPITLKTG